jgi:vancomycin resistance protein YoaR
MGKSENRKIMKWLWVAVWVLIALLLLTVFGVGLAAKQFRDSERIAPKVRIEGVPVGGMTAVEATRAVEAGWVSKLPQTVALRWPGGTLQVPPDQLGAHLYLDTAIKQALRVGREGGLIAVAIQRVRLTGSGVDLRVESEVDPARVEAYLYSIAPQLTRKPKNAGFKLVGTQVQVTPDEAGVELDVKDSAAKLAAALKDPKTASFDLTVRSTDAAVKADRLRQVDTVLASYSTKFRPWQEDRTHNLRLGIGKVNGALIMPGETLSLNQRIGPREEERGFRSAPIFVNGQVEPSTGGGICQVATTTYNAALLAGLDVVERNHHSRPVDYAPSGRDATVYWGQFDLKIRNNLSHPVILVGSIGSETITVKVLGNSADKVEVEILRTNVGSIGHGTQRISDPTMARGETKVDQPGRDGATATITRVIKKNGQVIAKERLHTDTYGAQNRIVRVGTRVKAAPENQVDEEIEVAPADDTPDTVKPEVGAPQPKPAAKPAAKPRQVKPAAPSAPETPTVKPEPASTTTHARPRRLNRG